MKKVEAVKMFKEEYAGLVATGNTEEISYKWGVYISELASNGNITIRQHGTWKEPKWKEAEAAPVVLITEQQIEDAYEAVEKNIYGTTEISYYQYKESISLNLKYLADYAGNENDVELKTELVSVETIVELVENDFVSVAVCNW